ncbi:Phosphoglycerate dehydrogenase [Nocardioides sp. YR527]|uniref:hydroxyacid dehydrogenase n=1 Tax=Nocardioides sp. YR527 TaxID=1881028 RepID=UPI00088090AB|nr:hydroxyacid dehydrogenase [Nocardioides sp. YR527]SDL01827.1 Phosphoglycerate dehydrogenase [Nocardioides sp. YR527]
MRAAFAMTPHLQHRFFDAPLLAELGDLVDIDADQVLTSYDDPGAADVEVLVTAWGTPTIDASALARMPRLRAVVHAAGSVKYFLSPEAWERDLRVTCGVEPNARPVAEYALAAVLWATKSVLPLTERFRADRVAPDLTVDDTIDGAYGTTVGLLGASATGRALVELLAPFDLSVLVSDPTIDAARAAEMGAELVGLDDLFARSRVVSLHAPLLPQTRHLVDARLLGLMGDGTTLINTARGGVVDHDALRSELLSGRLRAILDVTEPEPLPADDPMWSLPNVTLTPHVAGSQGSELRRLGRAAVDEVRALIDGRPPLRPVDPATLATSA